MITPASLSSGIGIAKNAWAFLEYLRRVAGADVVSGYFRHDGTPIESSPKIELRLIRTPDPAVWYFHVKPIGDYVFIREPVSPSGAIEQIATLAGEVQPDHQYWRWVAPTSPGQIYVGDGAFPNLKIDFMVFGYRPKALIKRFESKA